MNLKRKSKIANNIMAVAITILMVAVSFFMGEKEIIFPEIAALATGFFLAPKIPWNASPVKFVFLMTFSSFVGLALSAWLPVHIMLKIFIGIVFSATLLTIFKSNLYPLLSACILPIIMNTQSLYYSLSVFVLTLIIVLGKMFLCKAKLGDNIIKNEDNFVPKSFLFWIIITVVLMLYSVFPVFSTTVLLVAPPLMVMFVELVSENEKFKGKEILVLTVTVLCGFIGAFSRWGFCEILGFSSILSAVVTVALVIIIFEVFKIYFPPAAALAFLPLIIDSSQLLLYPVYIIVTASIITGSVMIYRKVVCSRVK